MSWSSDRKAYRFQEVVGEEISEKKYNMVLGGTVFYGLFLNVILCALFGDAMVEWMTGLSRGGMIFMSILMVVPVIIGGIVASVSHNPVVSFIGYNLVVLPLGLLVSSSVSLYLQAGMGDIVFQAIVYTAAITFIMIALACAFPNFFAKLGGLLLGALIGLIVAELVALLIFRSHQTIFAWLGAVIFSFYIGFDYWRAQQYPKTVDNAIDCAVDIYLDIINLFLRILAILSDSKD